MDTGTTVYYSQDNYTAGEYSHPSKVKDRLYDERRLQQPEDSQPSRLHTISHTPTVTPVPTLPAAPPPAVSGNGHPSLAGVKLLATEEVKGHAGSVSSMDASTEDSSNSFTEEKKMAEENYHSQNADLYVRRGPGRPRGRKRKASPRSTPGQSEASETESNNGDTGPTYGLTIETQPLK